MFAAIGSYWKRIPRLVGVEVLMGDGDSMTINMAFVKRTGTRVRFVRGEYGLEDMKALAKQVGSDVPVAIFFDGKGIIHRALRVDVAVSDALKTVLPNAKEEDFYAQHTEWEGTRWLSVVRRGLIDRLVELAEQQGMTVVRVALGPFATLLFSDYLGGGERGDVLRLDQRGFEAQEGVPYGKPVDIGGEQMNEKLVPAFALAFASISEVAWPQLPIGTMMARGLDYRERWAFKRSATVLMIVFVAVLLGNAFYFMHFTDNVSTLDGSDALIIQREMERLEQETAARDELLHGLWDADMPAWEMAYLADRIAASRPEGIRFGALEIYPRDEEASRKHRRPVHTPLTIHIGGACTDMQVLNVWMAQLRTLGFCERVAIRSYGYEERNAEGMFRLVLTLKP